MCTIAISKGTLEFVDAYRLYIGGLKEVLAKHEKLHHDEKSLKELQEKVTKKKASAESLASVKKTFDAFEIEVKDFTATKTKALSTQLTKAYVDFYLRSAEVMKAQLNVFSPGQVPPPGQVPQQGLYPPTGVPPQGQVPFYPNQGPPPQGYQGPPQGFQGPPPQGYRGPPQGFQGPPQGPNGQPQQPPPCNPTAVSGHCGGKTYFWDTAKESEPEEFKKCFYGDGPVGAVCNGKEYTWDPAKESKPAELESCEKTFLARQNQNALG